VAVVVGYKTLKQDLCEESIFIVYTLGSCQSLFKSGAVSEHDENRNSVNTVCSVWEQNSREQRNKRLWTIEEDFEAMIEEGHPG